jgi:hypothetical protein
MAQKLSSRQQAQLAYLQTLPPRLGRIYAVIEEMAGLRADDAVVRGLARLLDQIKAEAGALSLSGLAETAGIMGTMTRRGGGLQMKVRLQGLWAASKSTTSRDALGDDTGVRRWERRKLTGRGGRRPRRAATGRWQSTRSRSWR